MELSNPKLKKFSHFRRELSKLEKQKVPPTFLDDC